MKADIGRVSFDPSKHFSRVLLQQGRVQLESDGNEQVSILLGVLRELAADLIGPWGGSAGAFQIEPAAGAGVDVTIGSGYYYVEGVRCANDPVAGDPVSLGNQPWYPVRADDELPVPGSGKADFLLYLDVWERLVTADEDGDLRESALGGLDTAARAQVVWQVKAVGVDEAQLTGVDCAAMPAAWPALRELIEPPARGLMRARARVSAAELDRPCTVDPRAGYRFDENALFRVEVHRGGVAGQATFAWSLDNGSVAMPVEHFGGDRIQVSTLGRDPRLGLRAGDGVALEWDAQVLRNEPAPMFTVRYVDHADLSVLLDSGPTPVDSSQHPRLRRWDQALARREPLEDDGCVAVVETADPGGDWIDLDHGVQVQFVSADPTAPANVYRPGDYWLIPARTVLGDIVWPAERNALGDLVPASRPPAGVEHRYAPLAWVTVDGAGVTVNERFVRTVASLAQCP